MAADNDPGDGDRQPPEGRSARIVVLVGLGLLVAGLLAVAVATAVRSPAPRDATITATPVATLSVPAPLDTRAAEAFAARFEPPSGTKRDSVAADVDSDGIPEAVIASLVSRMVRVDLASWGGDGYAVVFTGQGGPADTLSDVSVADYTGDGEPEVVTVQVVGSVGQSLSIWGARTGGLSPQRATGGCADGTHTFGVAGARIAPGRILASCDGSPLPPDRWPVDEYGWDGSAWTYRSTTDITAGELRERPSVATS